MVCGLFLAPAAKLLASPCKQSTYHLSLDNACPNVIISGMFERASVSFPPLGLHPPSPAVRVQSSASTCRPVTPLFATLTRTPQLAEKSAALSPAFATLTQHLNHKSFVCHSYRKSGGVGVSLSQVCSCGSPLLSSCGPPRYSPSASFDILLHPFAFFCTFLRTAKSHLPSFQQNTSSLRKTPGSMGISSNPHSLAKPLPPPSAHRDSPPAAFLSTVNCRLLTSSHDLPTHL
jgi:hypothetical protein